MNDIRIRFCDQCGQVVTQFDCVDNEHNRFNVWGYIANDPMLCSKCWIEFKKLLEESKDETIRDRESE